MQVLAADFILPAAHASWIEKGAIAIRDGRILAIGPQADLLPKYPDSPLAELGASAILPGFVNAHQHGRGVSLLLMGHADDALEPWIAGRRRYGPPDIYAVTRLAAEEMLANGVVATLHANYAYGSGSYEDELDATIRAYRDSGIRATICIGFQDRGYLVYPNIDDAAFRASLAPDGAKVAGPRAPMPYVGGVAQTVALMELVHEKYRDCDRLTFAYGPAGPQWVSDAAWRALAKDAAARNIGLHFHLLESPAQAAACRALYGKSTLAHLRDLGVLDARASFAHGVHAEAEDLAVARAEGLAIVTNPGSNMRLFNGAPPLSSFFESGCVVALGTDNCALSDDEDYMRELRFGAILARRPGIAAHGPSPEDMLETATRSGVRASFLPEECGTLHPGAPADLVALDLRRISGGGTVSKTALLDAMLARGRGADVSLTMVAGEPRYRANAEDSARREHWRESSMRSIATRTVLHEEASISAFQAGIREGYAAPDTPSLLSRGIILDP